MRATFKSVRSDYAIAACVLVVFVVLSVGSALTKRPWSDEGWFATPALNLIKHGTMGTMVLEPVGWLKDIDRYTYWTLPLDFIAQAAWYKIFGFSLLSMRTLSMAWGILALLSWFVIVRALSGDRKVALLTFVLIAFDYVFITGASFGRMDLMSAALGFAGIAAYLRWRERNLTLAVFLSHTLVTASGLTHWNGILHFAGLIFLILYFDRARLRWQHVAVAAVPYLVGAAGWGLYILQSPSTFVAQITGNAQETGRLSGFSAPLSAFKYEITRRYLVAYGLGSHSTGSVGPIALKILIPIAYLLAIIGAVAARSIRQHRGLRALLIMTGIYFVMMTIIDGQKLSYYLLHIVPLYSAVLAVWLHWCWTSRVVPRRIVAASVCGLIIVQLGGVLYKMKLDSFRRSYLPATEFLKRNADRDTLIMGTADLGFELGFERNLVDDYRLGYYSGKRPDFFVVEEIYEGSINGQEKDRPEIYRHVTTLLDEEYQLVYDQAFFKIYAHRKRNAIGGL